MGCDNCPLRLYNTKSYNLQGIGNPYMGNCIVVPNVDYKAYKNKSMDFSSQVEIIKQVLLPFTGEEDSNFYIVPLIRCNETISCEINNEIYSRCLQYFKQDVINYDFKNILLLGEAARRFLNINIKDYLDTICISRNNRKYFVGYSPFVKYVDKDLFDSFQHTLIKWYCSIKYGMFDYDLKLI